MIEQPSRTLVCSIVFLDIVDYSTKPVAEQLMLKQAFNKLLGAAMEHVPPRDRVVLDTGDGAGITFLGDPEDALFVAMSLRAAARAEATGAISVRIGINLGPVRLVKDINGQMNIIGDGINVAQRVMTFAQSGQLLVSRSFYEVVSCLSLDYASLFSYVGARTDKHVREHEVYSVGIGTEAARRVIETGTRRMTPTRRRTRLIGELGHARPFGVHRLALIAAPLAFILLVGGGVAVRAQMHLPPLALQTAPAPAKASTAPKERPRAAPAAQPISRPPSKREPTAEQTARAEPGKTAAAALVATGTVQLSILPWGEVFVDGKSRGVSPPLRTLEMPAGAHTIEVRNTSFPAYTKRIDVRSGKSVRISHRFR
ncbi:MAG: PEGA domain-containing protein [Betaproteobacteria bacterium]|nr:PEGA domain-containing protein [Betaproteobacteria bacterium]MDH5220617.1 PEGA domain-containing protein [Betaproteobacteria bacterium]MDH5350302.1 PEGA domain-containing protein [Betaproteobacteria bacterium]